MKHLTELISMDQALSVVPSVSNEPTVSSLVLNGELKESLEFQRQDRMPTRPLRTSQSVERMKFEQIPTY